MASISYDIETVLDKVRNIGIIAHIDAGKTTTTERFLFFTGQKHKIGEVHEGQATTDFMPQEQERGITIMSAAVTCFWDLNDVRYRINIIDTPGHVDFTAEVERSLRVLDGAVMIFDGKIGVEPQSETVWRQADKYGVPRICFVNKLNLIGGDFEMSLGTIRERLSEDAVAVSLPIGRETGLRGFVDLLDMKAYTYKNIEARELEEEEIPEDMEENVAKYREILIEKIVEQDDDLMKRYLDGEDIPAAELKSALRKGVISTEIYPVYGGDARTVVVTKLLDAVVELLPSPVDITEIDGIDPSDMGQMREDPESVQKISRKSNVDEPFSALVFKLVNDPHVGTLSYFRVYSGTVSSGTYVYNSTRGIKERVGRLVLMHADEREEVEELRAGDIGAIIGLKGSVTGDTLCDEEAPIVLEQITFAEPVVSQAVEPKSKDDSEKLGLALGRLAREDPTFNVESNQETGQTIISGMGELHLEIIVDRLKREFNVDVQVGKPQVAYRETIKETREQEAKYIKQSGGRGQYGHCFLRLEPNPDKGFEFLDEVKGGAIPKEFISSVRKGVEGALKSGVIAGYPVIDVKVTVYDGSYHEVDSSDAAFQVAGSKAFKMGCKRAKPILMEPVMAVNVTIPQKFLGDVTGMLNGKRGKIEATEIQGKLQIIKAKVPLAELFGFTSQLRSITSGRGSSYIEMSHYAEVPKSVTEDVTGIRE